MKHLFKFLLIIIAGIFLSVNSFSQYYEKIILQTDRDIYIAGEEILFNAFCFSPISQQFLSKVLYVEIFDKEKNIITQKKLEINDGVASGSLYLPKSIKTNVYFVRGYTNYLKNFNSTFFPTCKVTCVNPSIPPNHDDFEINKHSSIQFNNSKSANINIKENQNHYNVEVELEKDFVDYLLKAYSENYQEIVEFQLPSSHQLHLSKSILPFGIIYLALVNNDEEVITVRPFYNWPVVSDSLIVEVNDIIFKPREKVDLIINNKNSYNYLSAVVVPSGTLNERNGILSSTILNNVNLLKSYLLENHSLVNQLKDTVDFFLKNEGKRISQTESFEKQIQLINNDLEIINKPEIIGSSIKGRLVDGDNRPIPNEELFLSVFEGNKQFHSTFTDNKGQFYFSLYPNTYSLNRIVLRTGADKMPKTNFLIDYDFSNQFPEYSNIKLDIDSAEKKMYEELYINQQICENTSPQLHIENRFDKQFGTPDYLIDLNDYINLPKLEEVFNEIVPHASIKRRDKIPYLSVFDETRNVHYDNPLLLLDFVPIFNIEEFLNINPLNVKSIAVINRSYRLGEIDYRGVVNVSTKKNNFSEYPFPNNVVFFDFEGVSFPYNFKNKKYFEDNSQQNRIPDFRTVLYWNPNVKTDTISFFTSDYCADYQVLITGIDKRGNMIKSLQNFTVKQ